MHAIVRLLTLLAGDTDSLTVTASGASLLSTDTDTPSVTETTVSTALPETLEGFAHLGVEQISVDMGGLAILNVLLGVNEPRWHELQRVLDNSDDLIDLLGSQLAGTLLEVDLGLLAHHEGETATDTTDGGQGERHLVATVNIGIQYAQNVLELILREDKSHPVEILCALDQLGCHRVDLAFHIVGIALDDQ